MSVPGCEWTKYVCISALVPLGVAGVHRGMDVLPPHAYAFVLMSI